MSSLTEKTRERRSCKYLNTTLAGKLCQCTDEHEKCMTPSLACLLASDTDYFSGNLSSSKAVGRSPIKGSEM